MYLPETKQLLTQSLERIGTPEKLINEFFGADENGNLVWETDPKACRFCLIGTLRVHGNTSSEYKESVLLLNDIISEWDGTKGITDYGVHLNLMNYNRLHGHADVTRLIKVAIHRCDLPPND